MSQSVLIVLLLGVIQHFHCSPTEVYCEGDYISDPEDPSSFYQYTHGVLVKKRCAPGTVFNPSTCVCDWPQNVNHQYTIPYQEGYQYECPCQDTPQYTPSYQKIYPSTYQETYQYTYLSQDTPQYTPYYQETCPYPSPFQETCLYPSDYQETCLYPSCYQETCQDDLGCDKHW